MRNKSQDFCNFAVNSGFKMLGFLVKSTAGRDCGRFFVVIGKIDEKYILLADGDLRPIEKPKRKKLRHVQPLNVCSPELCDKLVNGKPILNAELRKTIAALVEESTDASTAR